VWALSRGHLSYLQARYYRRGPLISRFCQSFQSEGSHCRSAGEQRAGEINKRKTSDTLLRYALSPLLITQSRVRIRESLIAASTSRHDARKIRILQDFPQVGDSQCPCLTLVASVAPAKRSGANDWSFIETHLACNCGAGSDTMEAVEASACRRAGGRQGSPRAYETAFS